MNKKSLNMGPIITFRKLLYEIVREEKKIKVTIFLLTR
jgi:hypothetical protein